MRALQFEAARRHASRFMFQLCISTSNLNTIEQCTAELLMIYQISKIIAHKLGVHNEPLIFRVQLTELNPIW